MGKKYNFYVMLLIIFTICINCLYSLRYYQEGKELSPDQELYKKIAISICEGKNYYFEGDKEKKDIGIEVAPAYSAIVAGLFKIFGENNLVIYLFQIILNIICVVVLFGILSCFLKQPFAFIALLLFELYYPLWRMNFAIMFEVTTVCMLIISLYFLQKTFQIDDQSVSTKYLLSFFLFFGLLIFINNRFIFHFIFVSLFLFAYGLKNTYFIKTTFGGCVIVLLILSPWFIRQYIFYDQFVLFTPTWNNVSNRAIGFPPKVPVLTDLDNVSAENKKPWSYKEYIESFKKIRGETKNYEKDFTPEQYRAITANYEPDNKLKIYLSRIKLFWSPFILNYRFVSPNDVRIMLPSTRPQLIVGILFLLPVMIFSITGMIYSARKKNLFIMLLSVLLVSHILLHVITHSITRYRLTILPVMFILACYGISIVFPVFRIHKPNNIEVTKLEK